MRLVSGAQTGDPSARSGVCAAIVTYNIGSAVHRCFDSIVSQVGHVVIVDNGSDESTRQELEKLAASDAVTIILNQRNEGLAHAFNQAVEWAKENSFQWILTLDHDSQATPTMIEKLLGTSMNLAQQGVANIGVVGANPFDVNIQHFLYYQPRPDGGMPLEDTEVISSGSLIPLRVFDSVGLFNEDLFIYYVDTEFCKRLTRAGFRVFVCPEAVLHHREGSRRRRRFFWGHAYYDHYGKAARYYLTRNTVYMLKNRCLTFADLYWILRRQFKDHLKILFFDHERLATLRYSLRGLLDGLRGKVGPLNFTDAAKREKN